MECAVCGTVCIPSGVFFVLGCQLSPTQMKCTCKVNNCSYILYAFFHHNEGQVRLRWLGAVLQHSGKFVVFQLSVNVIMMIIHH